MLTTFLYCFYYTGFFHLAFVSLALWNMLIWDVLEYGTKKDYVNYCIVVIINKYHCLAE